jgi:hypothetical protein
MLAGLCRLEHKGRPLPSRRNGKMRGKASSKSDGKVEEHYRGSVQDTRRNTPHGVLRRNRMSQDKGGEGDHPACTSKRRGRLAS